MGTEGGLRALVEEESVEVALVSVMEEDSRALVEGEDVEVVLVSAMEEDLRALLVMVEMNLGLVLVEKSDERVVVGVVAELDEREVVVLAGMGKYVVGKKEKMDS